METTLMIKTNKKLRDEAKIVANELGIPLTTVMNSLLKQFVRERKFSVSAEPTPTKGKLALWNQISADMDRGRNIKSFNSVEALLKDLRIS